MIDAQTQTAVRYDRDADGIVTLTLDDPTASANTMNELYQSSMEAAVQRLRDEQDDVTGVVVASAKKTFFAGGNLKSMVTATPDDAEEIFAMGEAVKASLRALETFPGPSSRRSTAPPSAVGSRSRSRPTGGSRSTTARSRSACPSRRSACCPAAAGSPASYACSGSSPR